MHPNHARTGQPSPHIKPLLHVVQVSNIRPTTFPGSNTKPSATPPFVLEVLILIRYYEYSTSGVFTVAGTLCKLSGAEVTRTEGATGGLKVQVGLPSFPFLSLGGPIGGGRLWSLWRLWFVSSVAWGVGVLAVSRYLPESKKGSVAPTSRAVVPGEKILSFLSCLIDWSDGL